MPVLCLSILNAGGLLTPWLHCPIKRAWWCHQMEHFPRYWPFVRGIHRSPVNSPHKGKWRGALIFSLICAWISGWVNNRMAGDLRRYRAHYDITVMVSRHFVKSLQPILNYLRVPISSGAAVTLCRLPDASFGPGNWHQLWRVVMATFVIMRPWHGNASRINGPLWR